MKIEDDQKYQNADVVQQELSSQQKGKQDQVKWSPYLQKYKARLVQCQIKNIQQYSQELKNNNIFYNLQSFQEHPHFTILSHSNQYKVVRLAVSFSYFTVEVKILNFDVLSPTKQNLATLGFGSYSQVFKLETQFHKKYEKMAIKCVRISYSQASVIKVSGDFNSTIFQYSLYKLFSVFRIGPYLPGLFGFDLFIYKDTIQFAMELCSRPCFQQVHNLMKDLATMHKFNIIHGDIKPQNIMWSEKYEKNVFVDFGLSKILRESIGEMTFTHFFGTYGFCSEEMKNLFFYEKKFDKIDLYYNDMFALEKSMTLFSDESFKTIVPNEQKTNKYYMNQLLNNKIVSLVFEQDVEGIQNFVIQFPCLDVLPETQNFFREINWSKQIARIIIILINSYHFPLKQELILFSKLKSLTFVKEQSGLGFKERANQLVKQFNGTLNEIMLFILIFYKIDITPRAFYVSQLLKQKLLKFEAHEEDWQNLVKYSANPYVEMSDLEQIFEVVKDKIKICEWQKENKKQLRAFVRSKQIADVAKTNYGINLYQMNDQQQKKQLALNALYLQTTESSLADLQKRLLQSSQKGILFDFEQQKRKLGRHSSRIIELIAKAEGSENRKIKSYYEIQSFLSNFKCLKAAFKAKPLTLLCQAVILQYFFHLNIYESINLEINFFSHQSLYVFAQQRGMQICAYDQIYFHLMKPESNLALFQSQVQSMLRFISKLDTIEAYHSGFAILYKAFLISFEILQPQLLIQHAKIIYCGCKILLSDINYKFCLEQLKFLFPILLSLPVKPIPQLKQFVSLILENAKQLTKEMTNFELKNFILDRIAINQKYQMCSKQVCFQQLRLYFQHFQQSQNQILKSDVYQFRLYSLYILLAFSCKVDPKEQFLHFIKLAFEQIPTFEEYPFQMYVVAFFFSAKSMMDFGKFFDIVLKIIEFTPKQSLKKEENFYILTCLEFLVFRYLLNKKDHFAQLKQLFYNQITKVFRQNPSRFCERFANSLIILEILLKLSFILKSPFEKGSILGMLNIASLIIERCIFSIKRSFINSMTVWSLELINSSIFEASKRKESVLKLKYLRNCQFVSGRQTEELFLSKFRNKRFKIFDGLSLKFNDLRKNKLLYVGVAVTNLKRQYSQRLSVLLNSQTPNRVRLKEQYFFSKFSTDNIINDVLDDDLS